MSTNAAFAFGDNVRIRTTPLTQSLGLAGLAGQIYGETTPSVTSITVIGELQSDYAINVFLEERDDSFWVAPDLVEFVDHAPGTQVRLDGIPKSWVRSATGEWLETDDNQTVERKRRPWWKFW